MAVKAKSSFKAAFRSWTAVLLALSTQQLMALSVNAAPDMKAGIKKYDSKDYQGALNEFRAVVQAHPQDGLAHYYMALCNQCLARVGEAKAEYEKVVQLGPANLKDLAQTGLNQLSKVSTRTGGTLTVASTTSSTAASTDTKGVAAKGTDAKDGKAGKDGKGDKADAKDAKPTQPNIKVVYQFYVDSSPGCKSMESTWDETKTRAKYKGIEFVRLNCSDVSNSDLVNKFSVNSYPTLVIVDQGGKTLASQVGAMEGEVLSLWIDTYLKK